MTSAQDPLERGVALLVADLQLAALEDVEDDVVERLGRAKGLGQVGRRRRLALADVEEDVVDLQHVVEVLLGAVAPLQHLVLVARELEAFLAWAGQPGLSYESGSGTFLHPHERHVRELDLIGRLVDRHFG